MCRGGHPDEKKRGSVKVDLIASKKVVTSVELKEFCRERLTPTSAAAF